LRSPAARAETEAERPKEKALNEKIKGLAPVGISGILFLVETGDSGVDRAEREGRRNCPLPVGRPKLLRVATPGANDSEAILNILLNRGARRTLSQLFCGSGVPAGRSREVELHSRECVPSPWAKTVLFFTGLTVSRLVPRGARGPPRYDSETILNILLNRGARRTFSQL
jgi:hypothetical protein